MKFASMKHQYVHNGKKKSACEQNVEMLPSKVIVHLVLPWGGQGHLNNGPLVIND